jgi:hypothetical protein
MSNLGAYQTATTWCKKVGGVGNMTVILMVLGYGCGKIVEISGRAIAKRIRAKKETNQQVELIEVTSSGTDSSGLLLNEGDTYRVLYSDENMVLVEKIGAEDNPHMVSPDFLRSVSNYR